MSNTVIQLKHSTETGNVPSGLVNGEIAINTFDGKLFYRDPSGVTQSIQNFPGPAGLNGEIQFNSSGDLGSSSGLVYDGSALKLNGRFESLYQSGDEGGELYLKKPVTNTSITDGITIDAYQNKVRIFETGGTNRGVYIDITECAGGVGTNLLSGGGGGTLDQTARNTANAAFDKANSANVLAQSSFDKANAAYDLANSTITLDTSPPASGNSVGDRWIDSNTGIEYTWIIDNDSSQWVELGPTNVAGISGGGGNVDFTAVTSNIVPSANVTYDLGSPTKRWRDIYLSGNTIDLGGAQLKSDANSGALLIVPSPTAQIPNPKATLVSPSGSITAIETSNGTVNIATIETVSSGTSDAFFLNSNTVSSNVTIPSGKNAISGGPITIAANVEVTISPGSEWTVV